MNNFHLGQRDRNRETERHRERQRQRDRHRNSLLLSNQTEVGLRGARGANLAAGWLAGAGFYPFESLGPGTVQHQGDAPGLMLLKRRQAGSEDRGSCLFQ
jgi:hypothetical protein